MTEKKYLRKLRNMLSQINLHIYKDSDEKTYIDIIKKYAMKFIKMKEDNDNSGLKYKLGKIYVDLYNIIKQYNTSEETIKQLYNEEQIKLVLHKRFDYKQNPIVRRDNKGVLIGMGFGGNKNMTRYPKKNRPLKVWKKFYEMFPIEAKKDN